MAERTKRGDEERKEEDDAVSGQPTGSARSGGLAAGTPGPTTTRDKGVEPAADKPSPDGGGQNESP